MMMLSKHNTTSYRNNSKREIEREGTRKKKEQILPWERRWIIAVIIHNFRLSNRSRMLNDGSSYRVDPIFFLLIRISDEIHALSASSKLEWERSVENIFCAFHSEAWSNRNDSSRFRSRGNVTVFEPEKLPSFENKPPPSPCLQVLTLLHEPSCSLRIRPRIARFFVRFFSLPEPHERVHGVADTQKKTQTKKKKKKKKKKKTMMT